MFEELLRNKKSTPEEDKKAVLEYLAALVLTGLVGWAMYWFFVR